MNNCNIPSKKLTAAVKDHGPCIYFDSLLRALAKGNLKYLIVFGRDPIEAILQKHHFKWAEMYPLRIEGRVIYMFTAHHPMYSMRREMFLDTIVEAQQIARAIRKLEGR